MTGHFPKRVLRIHARTLTRMYPVVVRMRYLTRHRAVNSVLSLGPLIMPFPDVLVLPFTILAYHVSCRTPFFLIVAAE